MGDRNEQKKPMQAKSKPSFANDQLGENASETRPNQYQQKAPGKKEYK